MSRLLDDLLEVSRITRGKLKLRKERIDLNDSLAAAVETARPLIEARAITSPSSCRAERIEADADPVRFAQIFSNLLTNAAKYTDPGGRIRVELRVRDGSAVVASRTAGSASPPSCFPTSSRCSRRPPRRSSAPRAGSASAYRSRAGSSRCMAAPSSPQ